MVSLNFFTKDKVFLSLEEMGARISAARLALMVVMMGEGDLENKPRRRLKAVEDIRAGR